MDHTHPPHGFSREWFALHPVFGAWLKRGTVTLGAGTLLAGSAFLVTQLETELNTPLQISAVVSRVPDTSAPLFPAVMNAGAYLPAQFIEQEQRAAEEELPPQY